jgi:hypothetical protein
VDFDLKFTYVLVGWEGSAHGPDGIHLPEDKFYLGDAGYAYRPKILFPPLGKLSII